MIAVPENKFKRGLDASSEMIGVWSMSGSPVIAEALGWAGYDFVVLDMEHGPNDVPRMLLLLQAMAGTPASPVVRLPWNDPVVVKQVLDIGAQTLMFPYVQTGAEAEKAVAATRYPPAGMRGVAGMSRATRFGGVAEYFARAADEICVIVQIETGDGLARLDEIAGVPGIDSIFIGPNDLAASLGAIGKQDDDRLVDALKRGADASRSLGKPSGILAPNVAKAEEFSGYGYNWLAVSSDLGLMMSAARHDVDELKHCSTGATAIRSPSLTTPAAT